MLITIQAIHLFNHRMSSAESSIALATPLLFVVNTVTYGYNHTNENLVSIPTRL